jgi:hypothetical protein
MARASANCKGWAGTGKALDYATRGKIAHVSCIVSVPNKALEQLRGCKTRTAGRSKGCRRRCRISLVGLTVGRQ